MADCRICVQDCSIHEDVWKALKENCRNYKPKPMTNADEIRAMSDEELAHFMANIEPCRESAWFDWLRQEVNDDP